jgi:hypothetical protein
MSNEEHWHPVSGRRRSAASRLSVELRGVGVELRARVSRFAASIVGSGVALASAVCVEVRGRRSASKLRAGGVELRG